MHNPKSVEFHQCSAKRHSICLDHNIKEKERNLCQDLFITENLKVRALHYANELLVRVRLSFQNLLQNSLKMQKQYEKMFGKRVMTRSLCR